MVRLLAAKTLRDMLRTASAYLICAALVALGFLSHSTMALLSDDLGNTRARFYRESAFPDLFADVVVAPRALERRLARLDGVERAEGRLVETARVLELGQEARLRLSSLEEGGLSRPRLLAGSFPGENELLVGEGFLAAHGLSPGDRLTLAVGGRKTTLTISGTGASPENIYMIETMADLMPEPATYDAGYLPYETLAALTGQSGLANSFVLTLAPSAPPEPVQAAAEQLLAPYGCRSVLGRESQTSHAVVQAELDQLARMSTAIPVLFLSVTAIILTIQLRRMVEQQRAQVGALLALGATSVTLLLHYGGYGALVGLLGGLAGGLAGLLSAGSMADFFRVYFNLPSYGLPVSGRYLLSGTAIATVACALIAASAARALLVLTPAAALRPATPVYSAKVGSGRSLLLSPFTLPGRIALRSLSRHRRKTALSIFGMASAYMVTAALVSMYSLFDVFMFDELAKNQRQDILVGFSRPVSVSDARRAVRLDGIERAEAVAETGVTLRGRSGELDCALVALEPDATLYRLYDVDGHPVAVEADGLVVTQHMAGLLGVSVGDTVEVTSLYPRQRTESTLITGVAAQYMGGNAYTTHEGLARLTDLRGAVTALYLKAPAEATALLTQQLDQAAAVASVEHRLDRLAAYRAIFGSFDAILFTMALTGVLIGFAVVYTGSLVSFEELKREIATLLALGLDAAQALEVVSVGQWVTTLGGILLGIPMAAGVSRWMSVSMSTELYSLPDFISADALLLSVGLTLLAVWCATWVIRRRIAKLDPVELLRERE